MLDRFEITQRRQAVVAVGVVFHRNRAGVLHDHRD
jgi:hypothetical protein